VFTCYLINVLWCYFILKSVPQVGNSPNAPSLLGAELLGEISTIPLVEIIKMKHNDLSWISGFIDTFVLISISVSFITIGSGFKQYRNIFVKF
jgi:hypothetical protein